VRVRYTPYINTADSKGESNTTEGVCPGQVGGVAMSRLIKYQLMNRQAKINIRQLFTSYIFAELSVERRNIS